MSKKVGCFFRACFLKCLACYIDLKKQENTWPFSVIDIISALKVHCIEIKF